MVGDVLVYNFQILFKQTSIIAADIYKHVSVLPSQKRYWLLAIGSILHIVAQRDKEQIHPMHYTSPAHPQEK